MAFPEHILSHNPPHPTLSLSLIAPPKKHYQRITRKIETEKERDVSHRHFYPLRLGNPFIECDFPQIVDPFKTLYRCDHSRFRSCLGYLVAVQKFATKRFMFSEFLRLESDEIVVFHKFEFVREFLRENPVKTCSREHLLDEQISLDRAIKSPIPMNRIHYDPTNVELEYYRFSPLQLYQQITSFILLVVTSKGRFLYFKPGLNKMAKGACKMCSTLVSRCFHENWILELETIIAFPSWNLEVERQFCEGDFISAQNLSILVNYLRKCDELNPVEMREIETHKMEKVEREKIEKETVEKRIADLVRENEKLNQKLSELSQKYKIQDENFVSPVRIFLETVSEE